MNNGWVLRPGERSARCGEPRAGGDAKHKLAHDPLRLTLAGKIEHMGRRGPAAMGASGRDGGQSSACYVLV